MQKFFIIWCIVSSIIFLSFIYVESLHYNIIDDHEYKINEIEKKLDSLSRDSLVLIFYKI